MIDRHLLPAAKGTYAVLFHLPHPTRQNVGRFGLCDFPEGEYVYIGSAQGPGGLRARLSRHLTSKVIHPHWHIDAVRACMNLVSFQYLIGAAVECNWVQALVSLPGASVPVPGLGASDCRCGCPAHLIRFS